MSVLRLTNFVIPVLLSFSILSFARSPDLRRPPTIQLDEEIQKELVEAKDMSPAGVRSRTEEKFEAILNSSKTGDVELSIASLRRFLNASTNGKRLLAEYEPRLARALRDGNAGTEKSLATLMENSPELVSQKILKKYSRDCKKTAVVTDPAVFCAQAERILSQQENLEQKQKAICGETEKDLSSEMPPIRNQTDLGWCFAFTTADLLSFEMKVDVSPASVAQTFYSNPARVSGKEPEDLIAGQTKSGLYEGGRVPLAVKEAQEKGVCLEKDFPSEFLDSKKLVHGRASLTGVYQEIEYTSLKIHEMEGAEGDLMCQSVYRRIGSKAFPNIPDQAFVDILRESSHQEVIGILSQQNCQGQRQKVPANLKLNTRKYSLQESSQQFKDLMSSLQAGHPVALSINAAVLRPQNSDSFVSTGSNHAVTAVGKRWNSETKSCEIKIRNSWGKRQKMEWFPASMIMPATRGLTYLSK